MFGSEHPIAAAPSSCAEGKGQALAGSSLSCDPTILKRFYFPSARLVLGLTWLFEYTELCFTSTMYFQPSWKQELEADTRCSSPADSSRVRSCRPPPPLRAAHGAGAAAVRSIPCPQPETSPHIPAGAARHGQRGTLGSGLRSAAGRVLEEMQGLSVKWLFPADDLSTLGRSGPACPMSPSQARLAFLVHWGTRNFCCDTFFCVFFFPLPKTDVSSSLHQALPNSTLPVDLSAMAKPRRCKDRQGR